MPVYTTLALYKGFFSNKTLGSTGQAFDPDAPDSIDLLDGTLKLRMNSGEADFNPQYAATKNSGVWSDPPSDDGRQLIAGFDGNVKETIVLVGDSAALAQNAIALSKLNDFARSARDYFQTDWQNEPVYIGVRAAYSTGVQYALVYDIQVAAEQDWLGNVNNAPVVTLVLEREPLYRIGVPPSGNPKLWTFFTRNLIPTNNASPSASEFNYLNTDVLWTGAAGYNSLAEVASLSSYDELGTSDVNFIDIPAASIPGDAPALALISLTPTAGATLSMTPIVIARDTRPDAYTDHTAVSIVGTLTTKQKRNTLNGGDGAPDIGSWGVVANAAGLRTGTVSARQVVRHNTALVAADHSFGWDVYSNQWRGRYAVYIRAQIVTGARTDLTLSFGVIGVSGNTISRTPNVSPAQIAYGTTFLGVVDFTPSGGVTKDKLGAFSFNEAVRPRIFINKAAAVAVDCLVWDVVLMPIDEACAVITPDTQTWGTSKSIAIDNTGALFNPDANNLAFARIMGSSGITADGGKSQQYRGVPILLQPNVKNRLYFLLTAPSASDVVLHRYRMRVDIVPRSRGLRPL